MSVDMDYIRLRTVEEGDCLLWQGATDKKGRPIMRDKERKQCTAVRTWIARQLGQEIAGLKFTTTTTCGDPRCVNPKHVRVISKGEHIRLVNEKTGFLLRPARLKKLSDAARKRSKATPEIVAYIRSVDKPMTAVAKELGIPHSTVCYIRTGKQWKDMNNPFSQLMR